MKESNQMNPRDTRHRLNCDGIIVHSLSGGGDQHTPIVLSFTNPSHPSASFFLLFVNRRFLRGNVIHEYYDIPPVSIYRKYSSVKQH